MPKTSRPNTPVTYFLFVRSIRLIKTLLCIFFSSARFCFASCFSVVFCCFSVNSTPAKRVWNKSSWCSDNQSLHLAIVGVNSQYSGGREHTPQSNSNQIIVNFICVSILRTDWRDSRLAKRLICRWILYLCHALRSINSHRGGAAGLMGWKDGDSERRPEWANQIYTRYDAANMTSD